jgi:hypothetical protein
MHLDCVIIEQMLEIFRPKGDRLLERVQQLTQELDQLRGDMNMRLQQVEEECARTQLHRVIREIHKAAQFAVQTGLPAALAIEQSIRALAKPLPRGRAGGLVRARTAWRYGDGTFMPEAQKFEAYRQEYERHAASGRIRAANAVRNHDGKFLANAFRIK